MENKEFFDHYSGLRVAEDGEFMWTTTYKTGHQHIWRTYGYDRGDGRIVVNYKGRGYFVHRLVAECFLNDGEPIPDGYEVHHINGNKSDNRAENLLIVSPTKHRQLHKSIHIIGTNIKTGETMEFESAAEAGRVLNICRRSITDCCRGKVKTARGWHFEYAA